MKHNQAYLYKSAGTSFMAVMLLRVQRKKLPCGSQKALQNGKAASALGSMSKVDRVKPSDHRFSSLFPP